MAGKGIENTVAVLQLSQTQQFDSASRMKAISEGKTGILKHYGLDFFIKSVNEPVPSQKSRKFDLLCYINIARTYRKISLLSRKDHQWLRDTVKKTSH